MSGSTSGFSMGDLFGSGSGTSSSDPLSILQSSSGQNSIFSTVPGLSDISGLSQLENLQGGAGSSTSSSTSFLNNFETMASQLFGQIDGSANQGGIGDVLNGIGSLFGLAGGSSSKSSQTQLTAQSGIFSSGWAQILINILTVIVGIVIVLKSFDVVPSISTTVNIAKTAGKFVAV